MLPRTAIEERVREWSLREDIVEKDYVLGWVLWGIGSDSTLSTAWAFTGGTCLKKCYVETWRFSEDLDFTVLPGGPINPDDLLPILSRLLERVYEESGIDFSRKDPFLKAVRQDYTEGRLYYVGPRDAREVTWIKLDISSSEVVLRPTLLKPIAHSYPENLPKPGTVRCYAFEELFAEKLRAMGERGRPRDLYDIVNLFRREDLSKEPALVRDVLSEKCSTKRVPLPLLEAIRTPENRSQLESDWGNMLSHQLPALPPFEEYWQELERIFGWLEGQTVTVELPPLRVPVSPEDEPEETWSPPPTMATWGQGVPIEVVRFAAVNHLCVELGYKDTVRVIEPYSLRRSRAGKFILYAIRSDNRQGRAYRVDRIQSVRALNQPFRPAYQVEF